MFTMEDGKKKYVDGVEGEETWEEYTCQDYQGVCWTLGCKNQSGIDIYRLYIFRKYVNFYQNFFESTCA